MNDDAGSLKPLTDSLVGGLLAIILITAPLGAISQTATNNDREVPDLQQSGLHLLREVGNTDGPTQHPI